MKTLFHTILASALIAGASAVVADHHEGALDTEDKQKSYAVGINMANILQSNGIEVDLDAMILALRHKLNDGTLLQTDEETKQLLSQINQEIRDRRAEEQRQEEAARLEKGASAKEDGVAFLAEKRAEEGVKATDSGLLYKVLKEGTGTVPGVDHTVTVHYTGRLIDGTKFDSSRDRGQPARFGVTNVIKGWTEALQMMPVGSTWELYIPSELAYGEPGRRPSIPPNSTLVFEVELLETKGPKPAKKPEPVTSDIIKVPSAEELKKGAKIEIIPKDKIDEYKDKAKTSPNDGQSTDQ